MFERRLYYHIDWVLIGAVLAICAIGLSMIYSATGGAGRVYWTQVYALGLGLIAMAVALIQGERLAKRSNWQPSLFSSDKKLKLPRAAVPRQVETIINHRLVNRTQIVAGVSGGVMVAPEDVLRDSQGTDDASIAEMRDSLRPDNNVSDTWWWDAQ